MIVLFGFYAPRIGNKVGATVGLGLSVVFTTIWFVLKDPFGIDNMYITVAAPFLCMLVSHVFRRTAGAVAEAR